MKKVLHMILVLILVLLFQDQGIAQWIKANGIEFGNTYALTSDGTNLFAGVYGTGLFRSTDNGSNWANIVSPVTDAYSIITVGSTLFAGNAGATVGSVFRSSDNGENWTNVLTTLYGPYFGVIGSTIFAASCGGGPIRRSTDYGDNWEPSNNGITQSSVTSFGTNTSEIFAATDYGHLFRSNDFGDHWSETGYLGSTITTIHINASSIFVGTQTEGPIYGSVYYSTDDGQNWTNLEFDSLKLSGCNITSILTVDDKIFVGTNGYGVFLHTKDETNWTNVGLESRPAWQILISGDEMIAGTNSGVWRRPLSEMITSTEEQKSNLLSKYILDQNYPNPFNNTTVIRYSVAKEGLVTLKVYNILGQEVATLVSEIKQAGNYEATFNSDQITSGVYLYKLTSGGFTQTKKMILLK